MDIADNNSYKYATITIVVPGSAYGVTFNDACNYGSGNSNMLVYFRMLFVDNPGTTIHIFLAIV